MQARADPPPLRVEDRLLAEAVRALEHDGRAPLQDPAADARAVEAGGDLERRITVRARALAQAPKLDEALRHVRQASGLVVAAAVVLALVAGGATARAILEADRGRPVNFFWALGGAVGVQTVLLVAWALLMLLRPRALAAGSLGGALLALGRWVAGRMHTGEHHAAAVEAHGVALGRDTGRWLLSSISHGVWVAFNVGCLGLVILLLSARHYTFTWETTILNDEAYRSLTRVVAFGPQLVGFPVPTAQQIAAAQWPPDRVAAEASRTAWSWLLIGSIVVYGLGPRLLLLAGCAWRLGRARSAWRLDTTRPGYLRLCSSLMPGSARLGVVDPAEPEPEFTLDEANGSIPATGPPAFLGLEIEAPASRWPPPLDAARTEDLGLVDDGEGRRRVLDQLARAPQKPRRLVVVCSLTTTPDRGHRSFLRQLRRAVGPGLSLVLTGGETLRRRDRALVEARVADWQRLAREAGLAPEQVADLDLDHLTDATRATLAVLAGAAAAARPARRVEQAFDLIAERAGRWRGAPETAEQAQLHQAIGALYRAGHAGWRDLLRAPPELKGDLGAALRGGAERVVSLLPARLRVRPGWLAAGAAAGALGCVAAATLVAPVAISALPAWTGLGAAVAGAVAAATGAHARGAEAGPPQDTSGGDAVRAAALFALLLELQGRGEATITRVLDQVLPEDDALDAGDARAVRGWLDGLRHRLDLALAAEGGP